MIPPVLSDAAQRRLQRARALELVLEPFDGTLGAARRLRRPRAVVYSTVVTAALLVAWAGLSTVDRVVRTQGRIVPSGKPQLVQHLEGGIVSSVHVREGDIVASGAKLVTVSDLMANSTRGEKRERLGGLQARISRLRAEAEGEARFSPPAGQDADSAEVRNEGESFTARQAKLRQTTTVLREQLTQKRHEIVEQQERLKGIGAESD